MRQRLVPPQWVGTPQQEILDPPLKRYVEVYHTSLKTKPKYKKNRPVYSRIPVDYAPMQDLSINIKMLTSAFGGYHLLLVITCDQTNFTIAVPLRDRQTQTVAKALIYRVIYLFGPPRQIVCDEAITALQTDTTKFKQDFIGPLFIDTALDKTHYRLKDATGLLLDGM